MSIVLRCAAGKQASGSRRAPAPAPPHLAERRVDKLWQRQQPQRVAGGRGVKHDAAELGVLGRLHKLDHLGGRQCSPWARTGLLQGEGVARAGECERPPPPEILRFNSVKSAFFL